MSRARDFIEDLLTPAVDAGVADDIRVCVSELATNAVRYGPRGRDFLVRVTTRDGTVRVEVHDAGDGAPRVCAPTCDDTRGRGLLVVAALADDWGVSGRDGVGKMVWAEFKARAAAKTPC
ncbi:ATP-binding protein [Streptomyces sp. CMB-StM0423]|uniref:ATP-binding protein n=1 Tax=Streptomyces sp. CMB-StM0423 TaxID=2059884 RepID=UPI000C6FD1D4|nr:ATP-binding protein [Streptomyces sp. CMB-StM0423]AUH44926.1 hypothetical protein CXR04_15720 [Streptomyces sp. CMB-StM0423]